MLVVEGDIDASTVKDFEAEARRVMESGSRTILVDCAGLQFIDSAALGRLVGILKDFRPLGGILALAAVRTPIKKTIEMVRLDKFIPIYPGLAEAFEALK